MAKNGILLQELQLHAYLGTSTIIFSYVFLTMSSRMYLYHNFRLKRQQNASNSDFWLVT
jgi:hypothetical protein